GLKDLTINVPAVVRSGDTVTLSCHYDLEGLPLYTIQWFLEDTEFYRYLPERDPPYSTFNVDGIHVNAEVAAAMHINDCYDERPTELPENRHRLRESEEIVQSDRDLDVKRRFDYFEEFLRVTLAEVAAAMHINDCYDERPTELPENRHRLRESEEIVQSDRDLDVKRRKLKPPLTIIDYSRAVSQVSKSNTHDVTLVDVSRKLTGKYKCEVSAGSPSYHTLIKRAKMEVVDAPKTDPMIGIEKERIAVGELFRANCTTGNSRPASAITWRLNGDVIANDSMVYRTRHLAIPQDDGSQVSKSTIDFKVTNDMFQSGRLHLRCTVSIADVYRKSADIDITEDAPRIASITGESPPRGHRE
ncbi:hypothetical protein WH47_04956, partial [Habropoda laboriosa]